MFIDIIFIICLLFLGYKLGKIIAVLQMQQAILDHASKAVTTAITQVYKLHTEVIGSVLYLYDDQDNFICQANTLEELAKLSHLYNNICYAAVMHDNKTFKFVGGVSSES